MTPIYLDHAASTPVLPRVRAIMTASLEHAFGNPHAEHEHAANPAAVVDEARDIIASLLGADPGEVVFTFGATEANNAALKGVMLSKERRGDHLVVTNSAASAATGTSGTTTRC